MISEPLRAWRHVRVTERRTRQDWAACIKEPVNVCRPVAQRSRSVLDSLNAHGGPSLYETFARVEARRLLESAGGPPHPRARGLAGHGSDRVARIMNPQCLDRRSGRGPARGRDPGRRLELERLPGLLDRRPGSRSAETEEALPGSRSLTVHW
jgi:hypothetical protein